MYIYIVTIAILYMYNVIDPLMWVVFCVEKRCKIDPFLYFTIADVSDLIKCSLHRNCLGKHGPEISKLVENLPALMANGSKQTNIFHIFR